ncbi:MAG: ShlB/FhaC/HecB family hemolysin secretion/activation protein [Pseudanabaenales cyanobacterium]|nr:ShlB/FhaC/HecB family hemolysin secretion/activation protein [Pseudanabaenales cyanobacterium]
MKQVFYGSLLLVGASFWVELSAVAQSLPPDPVEETLPGRPGPLDPLLELPSEPEDPIQLEREMPTPSPFETENIPAGSFFVEDIQVIDNTLFHDEIEALVQPLEGRDVTLQELLNLRTAITNLYIKNGYISSGAFVPTNQDLSRAVVQIQVVEGGVEQIDINGLSRLRDDYIRDRITGATSSPLNVRRLEEALQLLQIDPLLQSVDAELTAGSEPGQNILILDLTEADPFFADLAVNNYRAPSIGSLQGSVAATHLNLFGFGDRLSASYDLTEGLDVYEFRYAIPVNGRDGTVQLRYENADSNIVDSRFEAAGIRSESETFSFNFRQPLNRSLTNEFALGLGFDLRQSRSFILDDIPFSFSVGPEAGVSKVRTLRFSQEWVNRDINTVLAVRSQFGFGLDIFDATVHDSGTDGRFFSWLGQFQWVEQFSSGMLLVTRINTQFTPDSLLPLERFSAGGVDTVRGYAQNQIVTDNGVTASTELRFPVADGLRLTPFIDAGGGWNNQTPDPDPSFLLGLGLGLRWQPTDDFNLRIDYGIPLISPGDEGDSLQENGVYISVNLQPF